MTKTKIWGIVALMTFALVGIAGMQVMWIRSAIRLNADQFDEAVFSTLNAAAGRLQQLEELDAYVNGFSLDYFEQRYAPAERAVPVVERARIARPVPGHPADCTCKQCHQARISNWQQLMRFTERARDAPLENRIDPAMVDTLLHQELSNRGIDAEYTYGVFSNARRDFIIVDGHYVAAARGPQDVVGRPEEGESLETSRFAVRLYDETSLHSPGLLVIHFPQRSSELIGPLAATIGASALLLAIVLGCFAYSIFVIFRQKRLSMMKNDFISNMTHEFKTPIATISLAADSITNPKVMGSPERLTRFAEIIRQENRRMDRQVEKVLQAALIDRRDFGLRPVPTDVNECLREAAEHMALQVEKRGGTLTVGLGATSPEIEADPTHLSNLLHNLMDNANKYSPEVPEITVRTEDARGGVRIDVADRGIGMTKEDQAHVFDKFYRVHTGNRHDVKGFGLGLAYVKAVVEAHGGRLTLDSAPGKGSTFSVFLPHRIPEHLVSTK